jgi:transcription elongation factor GreA
MRIRQSLFRATSVDIPNEIGKFLLYEVNMTIPISVEGYRQLEKELERLKQERPAIIQAIKEAREEGDLSENAGYDAARERQGMVEAKITHLESRMAQFQIIDIKTMGGDKAIFGATVELEDLNTGETKVYTLLGPDEADYANGSISVQSPVGSALLGKEVGDEITVNAPRGLISYELLSIRFLGAKVTA